MKVRLAFAVAAHLEPEILIVDEVLAVGDIEFQDKCLGKMQTVAKSGRTVLFVSHNMTAMSALCSRVILMDAGQACDDGNADDVIDRYLGEMTSVSEMALSSRTDRKGNGQLRFTHIQFATDGLSTTGSNWVSGRTGTVTLDYTSPEKCDLKNVRVALTFFKADGSRLFACDTNFVNANMIAIPSTGQITCEVPNVLLAPGHYQVTVWASVSGEVADGVRNAGLLRVNEGDFFGTGRVTNARKHGTFRVNQSWRFPTAHGTPS